MSAPPDSDDKAEDAANDAFDPNALLQRFGERLRELDQPMDLSISLDALQSRRAMPAARGRWNMDDVTDVEDQSERRRALEARALEQTRQAEAHAQVLAQQQAREAEEQAAAEALAQARARLLAERQLIQAAAAEELARQQGQEAQAALARRHAVQSETRRLRERAEAQALAAQQRAEAERAAQKLARELKLDFACALPPEAPALDLASIAMPCVPAAVAPGLPDLQLPARADTPALDLSELSGLISRVAQAAAARAGPPAAQDLTLGGRPADYQRQPLSRAASSSSGTAASTPAPL